jgi:FG-GAP-like repeat/Bacterial Ig-like domain (group 3)/Chitobiase/beta-hexosaminidase C-terminal domain
MSPRENSASCHWIFDSLGFTLVCRMLAPAVRFAGAASLCVGIATGGVASAQTKAATVTSFSMSASGSVVAGTVVTLTAQVTAGAANVSPGQVNFCDATATYCTDIHILATAQLTSSGTATYKFRPGIGSHSYKAVFIGTNSYGGSISSASPLTVTGTAGPFATATSIAETGAWGNYTLTGTVTEAGGTVAPTGTVSFLDTSNGNSVLATGSLGAAVAGVGWPNPGSLSNTLDTYFVLVADLNGDGIPDLVLGSNVVTIYLGNAGGTYTEAAAPPIQGTTSYPIVVADFNGDGIPDLAVPLYGSNEIAVLLGKGDGTFAEPVIASVPGSDVDIAQIVAGEFNEDGIPDLAVTDRDNSTVDILLGNGDGTFKAETTELPISANPSYLAMGDFNGDGKTDLAVADNNGTIAILLGNGDGTFATSGSVNSASNGSPSPIAVADFNGDGKLDIAVPVGTYPSESVSVLTGNGDGTFNSPFSGLGPTSTSATWVQVADFNQDGAADVVLADSSGSAMVFLNNGGGSLSESFPVVSDLTVPYYLEVGVGDLNGDGYPDIVAGGYYNSAQGLYLTEPTETASASASVQVNGVGQHLAEASFPAEGTYESSVSNSIPLWGLLPATTTTLSVTSGGSTVTSVTPGTAVLLSAQVNAGTTPVTAGQVNFCDASAPHCTDIHILGSAALSSSGTATFTFVPGSGAHSYQAQFIEDGFGLASASNVASLTVGPAPAPVYSDTAAITISGGAPGDYSLTATVTGYGGPASPTGNVSFVDTSFGNNVLGTAALGPGTLGTGWLISQTPATGGDPVSEVVGDFNGDGIPDLALLWTNSTPGGLSCVTILFGKGDGTFTTGPTVQAAGIQSYPTMIGGDFNGDGKADLAVLSYNGYSISYITVLLGNGDGTFAAPLTGQVYNQGAPGGDVILGTLVAADFNGDGKLDLAVVGDYVSSGGVTILLGNGDGTFTAAGPNLDVSAGFDLIATGDFNGDGIPDLVTPNYQFGGSPTIFLGKGDGTFTFKPVSFTLDYFPTSVVVGDFNGDGILDLAFSDLNGVEIALGNGDGTFSETPASPIQVPSELYSLQAGDFNNDGKVDLAGLDDYFDQIVILLGNGDGTFAVTTTTPGVNASPDGPHQIAAADFNEDGVPDLAMLTDGVNTASILLTVPTETATGSVNGIALVGAGTHNVDASYAGDSHYSTVTSSTIPLSAILAPLIVTPAAGTYTSPQTLTITEAIPGSTIYYELTGTVSTNGYVQYTGPVSLSNTGVETLEAYATETGYEQSAYLSAQYTMNIPGFTLSASPARVSVPQGGSVTSTISSTDVGGFSGTVTLAATGLPSGVSASFAPGSSASTQVLTLRVSTSASPTTSPVTVTITGTSGSLNATTTVDLSITSEPGFAAGPGGTTSLTVTPGTTTGNTATISVAGTNGFSGVVNLTCSVTTKLTGVSDMPTCSLNPTSVTISGAAAQTSTLTVNTTAASSAENQKRSLFWSSTSGATFVLGLLFVRPRKRKSRIAFIGLLLLFVSMGLIACGGGSSGSGGGGGGSTGTGSTGTTQGAYTITVTGKSGSVSATVGSVALTVQ